jgi:protein SCO1/2
LVLGVPVSAELSRELVLGKSAGALGHVVEDRQFLTSDGGILTLGDLRGQPLIVNPIFTSCHQICPALTSHLAGMVDVARDAVGDDAFRVLTVGFDIDVDTPERMASFATKRGIDDPQWYFVSGEADTVRTFLDDIGFSYEPSPRGFDHLLQTTILDGDGRVFRHIYGGSFDAPVLVEPLKELVLGKPGGPRSLQEWIDTVRLFCTVYDPDTGRYRFDYSVLVAVVVGGLCLMGIAVFLIRAWRETLRAET